MNFRITENPTAWEIFLEKYWVLYFIVLLFAILFAIALIFCHACTPCDHSTLLQRIHELETVAEIGDERIFDPIVEDVTDIYDEPTVVEVDDRREEAGGEVGKVTATLIWNTKDDLDIIAIQPSGIQISPYTKDGIDQRYDASTSCRYDTDRNFKGTLLTTRPIENIFWEKPDIGIYKLLVRLHERQTTGSATINFTLHWKVEGQSIIVKHGTLNRKGNFLEYEYEY